MSGWKLFTRRDCPVCDGARKDCRQSLQSGLIHCRHTEANPADYKFIKEDALGFGMWAHHLDTEEWNEAKREEWQTEKEQHKQIEQKQFAKLLSVNERDRAIRLYLLPQLTLSEEHRSLLLKRGFTDEQIKEGNYRSVERWQKLDIEVNNRLAGVSLNGKRLNNFCSGILIPVVNENGKYVAIRFHNPNHAENNFPKYYWGTSKKRKITSHLTNGELPLTVCFPSNGLKRYNMIGLCEGLEYKPQRAAERLGIPVIGAAGGHFASSKEALQAAIAKIKANLSLYQSQHTSEPLERNWTHLDSLQNNRTTVEPIDQLNKAVQMSQDLMNPIIIVLIPDAEATQNAKVLGAYHRAFEVLESEQIQVAWWEQFEKINGDIDEISDEILEEIQYLSRSDFQNLTNPALEAAKLKEENQKAERFKEQAWREWEKMKGFSPQTVTDDRYFNYGIPQSGTILLVRSGLGSGKTTWLVEMLKVLKEQGAISLGYRNTLLLQFCEKTGAFHLHEHDVMQLGLLSDDKARIASCVDSLLHFQPGDFIGKILIIDEVVSVLKHLLFSTTIPNYKLMDILNRFKEALKEADRVIGLDALMGNWVTKALKAICPTKTIIGVENKGKFKKAPDSQSLDKTGQPSKQQINYGTNQPTQQGCPVLSDFFPKLYLLEGTICPKSQKIKKNDRSPWLAMVMESRCPVVCADSQIFLEGLEECLIKQGRKGIRIDSKTISDPEVKAFLANPTAYLESHQIDYLLYSPSAESGLDVPILDYFSEHFGFFFGCLDADAIVQMLGRIRDINVPKFLFVREVAINETVGSRRSPIAVSVEWAKKQALNLEINYTLQDVDRASEIGENLTRLIDTSRQDFWGTAIELEAMWNHERGHLRECVKRLLVMNGYEIISSTPDGNEEATKAKEKVSEATDAVKTNNSHDFFNASDKYVGQSDQVQLSFTANWADRCALTKAKLLDRLPEIEKDEVWSPELIKFLMYEERNLIGQLELRWQLKFPELAAMLSQGKYCKLHHKALEGQKIAPWRLKQQYSLVKALEELNVLGLLEPDKIYTEFSPEIKIMIDKGQSKHIITALGRTIGKYPMRYIGWLLKIIGYSWKSKQVRDQFGVRHRVYSVVTKENDTEENQQKHIYHQTVYQAIDLRYFTYLYKHDAPLQWFPLEKTKTNVVTDEVDDYINTNEASVTNSYNPTETINPEVQGMVKALENVKIPSDYASLWEQASSLVEQAWNFIEDEVKYFIVALVEPIKVKENHQF